MPAFSLLNSSVSFFKEPSTKIQNGLLPWLNFDENSQSLTPKKNYTFLYLHIKSWFIFQSSKSSISSVNFFSLYTFSEHHNGNIIPILPCWCAFTRSLNDGCFQAYMSTFIATCALSALRNYFETLLYSQGCFPLGVWP